jgi:hypothetical protein
VPAACLDSSSLPAGTVVTATLVSRATRYFRDVELIAGFRR